MNLMKDTVFAYIQELTSKVSDNHPGFTTSELSDELHMQRSNLSALLHQLVKENRLEKNDGRPVRYRLKIMSIKNYKEDSCFQKLIGHDGSLKNAVQLAKAAILYPERSLHTLILGLNGSGKSYFASLMYEFAIEQKVITKNAPFIKFNCRYYIDNEDDLIKHLFGTRDESDCLFERARGGILFIDHIDLLPSRSRAILFDLMEIGIKEINNIIIICATNNNIDKTLKEAYVAKFPVKIELTYLQSRKMEERLSFIQEFFTKEAINMKKVIKINSELLRCLLLYRCDDNVKQLKNDIRIGCANAYVREFNMDTKELHTYIHDFPSYIRKGFLFYKDNREEIECLIPQDYSYTFSSDNMGKVKDIVPKKKSQTVYDVIEKKAAELRDRGITEEDINTIISVDIENDLQKITRRLEQENINKESLSKIVNSKIITMVEKFLDLASKTFGRVYPVATFYGLCLHLSSTLERSNKSQKLSNDKIMEVVETYKDEYALCMHFASKIEKEFNVGLPIDEVIFITMFICDKRFQEQSEKKPVLLIAMHGNSTASSIGEVVNTLLKTHNTFTYDLSLNKDMNEAYNELKEYIVEIDQGKGILMLYDMGSLRTMAEMIAQETGIRIEFIESPTTLLALDCARKVSTESHLENVYEDIKNSYEQYFPLVKQSYKRSAKNSIIITLCMSGKGGAIQIKEYLEKNVELEGIDVIPLAVSDRQYLLYEVNRLKEEHFIICIIGTYNPELYGINFISISQLFETPIDKLPMLLVLENIVSKSKVDFDAIYLYLQEQLPMLDINKLKKYLPKAITKISKKVQELSQDQELGLFMHIACSIARMNSEKKMPVNIQRERIISKNKRLYNDICDIMEPLEAIFSVKFEDDEIANIISIIKCL